MIHFPFEDVVEERRRGPGGSGAFSAGGAWNVTPLDSSSFSQVSNCAMNPSFGRMIGRMLLTKSRASSRRYCLRSMIQAMTIVALLDIPAWQCTRHELPASIASSMNRMPVSKCCSKSVVGRSGTSM